VPPTDVVGLELADVEVGGFIVVQAQSDQVPLLLQQLQRLRLVLPGGCQQLQVGTGSWNQNMGMVCRAYGRDMQLRAR
jgi:hypothetical protein